MFLVDSAQVKRFSSRIVISLVAIFIIDEFDKMFIRNFIWIKNYKTRNIIVTQMIKYSVAEILL